MRIDLHIHSHVSLDADYPVRELMSMCAQAGLDAVALSDHNAVRGVGEARQYAAQYGLELIPAVELDCTYKHADVHVLGYGIDERAQVFEDIERRAVQQERDVSRELLRLVRALGVYVSDEDVLPLQRDGVINAEMIAEAALHDARNAHNPIMAPYFPGGGRSDNAYVNFYWDYCTRGKPAYVPMHFMPFTQAIEAITGAGGIAVVAHPEKTIGRDAQMLREMRDMGAAGIEVYCGYHDAGATEFFRAQAQLLGMLQTVGSDFHGKNKPALRLGGVACDCQDEVYHALKDAIA